MSYNKLRCKYLIVKQIIYQLNEKYTILAYFCCYKKDYMGVKQKIIKPFEGFQEKFVRSNLDLVIGGGSDIVFTEHFKGIVVSPLIEGIEIITGEDSENSTHTLVRVGAGVIWDNFVLWSI